MNEIERHQNWGDPTSAVETPVETPDDVDDYGMKTYDRQGNKISLNRWTELNTDTAYRIVAKTDLDIHGDEVHVSTVWLGLDHRFGLLDGDGPPIIFETMIFGTVAGQDMSEVMQERYSTEAEALAGHELAVAACRQLGAIEPDPEQGELE